MEELKKAPVTSILLIINIVVFLLVDITGGTQNTAHMLKCGASFAAKTIGEQQYYRLFTSMFLHFGMTHLANNMLTLFVLGSRLEQLTGKIRFLIIYLLGGILGNVISVFWDIQKGSQAVSAGASGAIFAVLGALIYLIFVNKGHAGDLSVRQIAVIAVLSLYLGFTASGVDNVAHVGGMLSGFVIAFFLYPPRVIKREHP